MYSQLIQFNTENSLQQIVLGKLDIHIEKKDFNITPYRKINQHGSLTYFRAKTINSQEKAE